MFKIRFKKWGDGAGEAGAGEGHPREAATAGVDGILPVREDSQPVLQGQR